MRRRIFLFCLSFLLSVGVFAVLYGTLHLANLKKNEAPAEQPTPPPAKQDEEPTPQPDPDPTPDPEPVVDPTPAPEPEPTPVKPSTPEESERALIEAVVAALRAEDPAGAMAGLVAEDRVTEAASAALLEWRGKHEPGDVEHVGSIRPVGAENDLSRWRLKDAGAVEDILMDLTVTKERARVESATPTPADKTAVSAASDPMTVSEGFIEAVRRGDMLKARELSTGAEVSDVTIAGLCMIFEEGQFVLRGKSPIRNSFLNDEHAGFIVYLVPQGGGKSGNFGLELTKEDMWRVSGISFDSFLASYEALGVAEGGHFFPIVKNPKGGDSLALFFSFDDATLSPRSLKQLQIVAELLKNSSGKLDVSGHTDDVGNEAYNQQLSEKRAKAVKDALVSFGVEAGRISTSGMGMNQPRRLPKSARTEEEKGTIRGANRRAEIYLDFVNPDTK